MTAIIPNTQIMALPGLIKAPIKPIIAPMKVPAIRFFPALIELVNEFSMEMMAAIATKKVNSSLATLDMTTQMKTAKAVLRFRNPIRANFLLLSYLSQVCS